MSCIKIQILLFPKEMKGDDRQGDKGWIRRRCSRGGPVWACGGRPCLVSIPHLIRPSVVWPKSDFPALPGGLSLEDRNLSPHQRCHIII